MKHFWSSNRTLKTFLGLGAALAIFSCVQAAESFSVSQYSFTAPAGWQKVEVSSPMRKAQLKVSAAGEKDSAEVIFFHFGPGDGGGAQANVERWYGQFQEGKPNISAKSTDTTVNGTKVTYVSAEGTYLSGMPGGPRSPMANYALQGAIIAGSQGSVFVKMTGPKAIVSKSVEDFKKLVESGLGTKK